MNLISWLRRKWAAMFPGRVYILNQLGVPTSSVPFFTNALPAAYRLTSRPPNLEDGWAVRWVLWSSDPGITLDHPESSYTIVRVAAGVPAGRYVIECVYTRKSDGAEFVSAPCSINVLTAAQYE